MNATRLVVTGGLVAGAAYLVYRLTRSSSGSSATNLGSNVGSGAGANFGTLLGHINGPRAPEVAIPPGFHRPDPATYFRPSGVQWARQ